MLQDDGGGGKATGLGLMPDAGSRPYYRQIEEAEAQPPQERQRPSLMVSVAGGSMRSRICKI